VDTSDNIVINTRSLTAALTGVQWCGAELNAFSGEKITKVSFWRPLQGMTGHLWSSLSCHYWSRGGCFGAQRIVDQ